MAKIYKRKLTYRQKKSVWYVCPSKDNVDQLVYILSEDKTLFLLVRLGIRWIM